jgi:hypothetical protein
MAAPQRDSGRDHPEASPRRSQKDLVLAVFITILRPNEPGLRMTTRTVVKNNPRQIISQDIQRRMKMQFLLLIYENEQRFAAGYDPAELQEYRAFGKE